jgi:hypothetical protein
LILINARQIKPGQKTWVDPVQGFVAGAMSGGGRHDGWLKPFYSPRN